MKFSIVLIVLAVVLIQQSMSAHVHKEGEKNDKDHETHMSNERGDHKDHKHEDCDHAGHKEEDHVGHEFIGHGIHQHEDHIVNNLRLGFRAEHHH